MKRILFLLTMAIVTINSNAQEYLARQTAAGTLWHHIAVDRWAHDPRTEIQPVKSLRMQGPMNGDDIKMIRELAGADYDLDVPATKGSLQLLDMRDARIVYGGESYTFYNSHGQVVYADLTKIYTHSDTIGSYMFSPCKSLSKIMLPTTLKFVEPYAFKDCCIEVLDFPDGVENGAGEACANCQSLKTVYLPATTKTLGKSAFSGCKGLKRIVCAAAEPPLAGDNFLTGVDLSACQLEVPQGSAGKYAEANGWSLLKNVVEYTSAPIETETFVVNGVVYRLEKTAEEVVAEVVKAEGELSGSLIIPEKVECDNHFYPVIRVAPFAFSSQNQLTSVSLPEGITSVGQSAFSNCGALTSVSLPSTVMDIGLAAFNLCLKLTDIQLPQGLTVIPYISFEGCKMPDRLIIPEGIVTIESGAFTALESRVIVLPATLKTIGGAFGMVKKVETIICYAVEPPSGDYPFDLADRNRMASVKLYVPDESIETYKQTNGWKNFDVHGLSEYVETAIDQPETEAEGGDATARSYTLSGRTATAGERGVVIQDGRKKVAK